MPANPQMEARTFLGNTSAGKASILATQPVYPSVARETRPMETVVLFTNTAGVAEAIRSAKKVKHPLRASVAGKPRRRSIPAIQPPTIFPMQATTKGIQA